MKKIIKYIAFIDFIYILYWLYLEFDAKTCAEMPQVTEAKRKLAEKYRYW